MRVQLHGALFPKVRLLAVSLIFSFFSFFSDPFVFHTKGGAPIDWPVLLSTIYIIAIFSGTTLDCLSHLISFRILLFSLS